MRMGKLKIPEATVRVLDRGRQPRQPPRNLCSWCSLVVSVQLVTGIARCRPKQGRGFNLDFSAISGQLMAGQVQEDSTKANILGMSITCLARLRSSFDQAFADGVADQLAAVMQIKLAHQIDLMGVDRFDAQV